MRIEGLQEKDIYPENYQFRLELNKTDNFSFPSHWHHAIEIVYPIENSYIATVNSQDHFIQEKDILIIPSGDIHSFNTVRNKGLRYFVQFNVSMLNAFGRVHNLSPYFSKPLLISQTDEPSLHQELVQRLNQLINEYENKAFAYPLALNARCCDFLVLLARSILKKTDLDFIELDHRKFYALEKLNKAFEYIEENFQQDLSLQKVAYVAGFSECHFSRMFKVMTGQNFHYYVTSRRIKMAETLLTTHNISIIDVALSSGFSSIATFNRTFRKIKKCTPMEYKKMQLF